MNNVAVGVTEDLGLDVTRALHQLFKIDLVLAKRCTRLATRLVHLTVQILFRADGAHAAPAATP